MMQTLQLRSLAQGGDFALLFARGVTGSFLVHGVWDNVVDPARMAEFAGFMKATGFPRPDLLAPFSVYTQLFAGLALIPGLLTRAAGLIIVATFVIGYAMVHAGQSLREGWPAVALVALGLIFATTGAGRFSFDAVLERRR